MILFGLWEFGSFVPGFSLSVLKRDAAGCFEALKNMLPALKSPWNPDRQPFFHLLKRKEAEGGRNLGELLLLNILDELEREDNRAYDFLRESPDFPGFLAKMKRSVKGSKDILCTDQQQEGQ